MKNEYTIQQTMEMFLHNIEMSHAETTGKTYRNALGSFITMLNEQNIPSAAPVSALSEQLFADYTVYLKSYSIATEGLYINVTKNYYEFLIAEGIRDFNLTQIQFIIKNRVRRAGQRLPKFPKHDIETIIDYAVNGIPNLPTENHNKRLINLRDSAFLITLVDTGLRVAEACSLHRNMVDWICNRATIIGKGNKEAVVRFSNRSIAALENYLQERDMGNVSGELPIFARHDRGAGTKVMGITTKTGRLIVQNRIAECLGEDAQHTITPHTFRHYFVTNVLRQTGNMKITQELARHSTIEITQRYVHLANNDLDEQYNKIFNGY